MEFKAKRYVLEFASDTIRKDKECLLMKPEIRQERKQRIELILRHYKRGKITDTEAMQCILDVSTHRREA